MENYQCFQHCMNAHENHSYSTLPRLSVAGSITCSQLLLSSMASLEVESTSQLYRLWPHPCGLTCVMEYNQTWHEQRSEMFLHVLLWPLELNFTLSSEWNCIMVLE